MDVRRTFTEGLDFFAEVLRAVPPHAWDNPTPCAEWTARDLTGHLVTVLDLATAVVRGADTGSSAAPTELGPDPAVDWTLSAARARAEIAQADLDTVHRGVLGDVPLREPLGFLAVDLYVHGWDLGRAVGRDVRLPEHVAMWIDDLVRHVPEEELRSPHTFDVEQPAPADADATLRLMAFLGRNP